MLRRKLSSSIAVIYVEKYYSEQSLLQNCLYFRIKWLILTTIHLHPLQGRPAEPTFSQYNNILTDERRSMSAKTLKQLLFIYFNASKLLKGE